IRTVEAFLGETVILPCERVQTAQNVYWRYMDSITVCDIIRGKANFEEQDPVFKDRVQLFPLEFVKGNFSIKLRNVDWSEEGIYTCNFPNTIVPETVQLSIKVLTKSVTIDAVVGGNVILPCSTEQTAQNVYWRHNDTTTVCDMIQGNVDFDEQHSVFQGRVETFPSDIAKGNFSIQLRKLKKSDAGIYTCNFPSIGITHKVYLKVT
ncbi:hypothetical protein C0J50_9471, partial [Silurus asotus]